VAEQPSADTVWAHWISPPAVGSDSLEWIDSVYLPVVGSLPGVMLESSHRPLVFLNLWGMTDPLLPSTAAWLERRDTPWMRQFWTTVSSTTSAVYARVGPPAVAPDGPLPG
jgi:hypothetical protein